MQSLRDKLLKAGLVTAEQAEKAESEKAQAKSRPRPQAPRERRGAEQRLDAADDGPIPKLPPLKGSKAHQRAESARQRAMDLELRELVLANQVPPESGSRTFHFVTRKGRLRRLDLSDGQAKLLEDGALAVVERQEPAQIEHALVPTAVAEKMLALFPKAVRFLNRPEARVGFLTEDELRAHQEAESKLPPEEPGDGSTDGPSEAAAPADGHPAAEKPTAAPADGHPAAEKPTAAPSSAAGVPAEKETWIAVKRAD